MRYSRIFRNSCSEIFTRSPPPASARVGGKWLVVSPVPHIISFPGSSLHFAPNSSLRTGCPYTTILERSPGSGAVQNRRADVARNTLLAVGPFGEELAGLLLLPFLLLLRVDFMTAIPTH